MLTREGEEEEGEEAGKRRRINGSEGGRGERSRRGVEGSSQAISLDTDSWMKRQVLDVYYIVHTWEPSLHPPP